MLFDDVVVMCVNLREWLEEGGPVGTSSRTDCKYSEETFSSRYVRKDNGSMGDNMRWGGSADYSRTMLDSMSG